MDSEHAYVYFSYDLDMTFGLYCAYTYPGASVRLTCWDQWTYFDAERTTTRLSLRVVLQLRFLYMRPEA